MSESEARGLVLLREINETLRVIADLLRTSENRARGVPVCRGGRARYSYDGPEDGFAIGVGPARNGV